MQSALYVGLSAQVALERRLNTIAQNVANMSTAGYRADEVKFETVLSRTARDSVAFATSGENFISRRAGGITKTDNPLDLAIDGEAWFAITTPAGIVHSRDGRLQIGNDGMLRTVTGYPVLDVAGAPIMIEADAGPPTIGRDGTLSQNGQQIGAIGLFTIAPGADLDRFEASGVIARTGVAPVQDFVATGVLQGYVEESNVNPIMEMTKLIAVSRAFDNASTAVNDGESSLREAIRSLGPST